MCATKNKMSEGTYKMMLCGKLDSAMLMPFLTLTGDKFIAEEKIDGVRARLRIENGVVSISNRRNINITHQYPELHSVKGLNAFFDGEIAVLDKDGKSVFNGGIDCRSHNQDIGLIKRTMISYPVTYVIFDILELDGINLRTKPYHERRTILEKVIPQHQHVKIIEQFSDIKDAWDNMCSRGREGLILKDKNSTYCEGYRSQSWRKVKNIQEIDLKFTKFTENPKGIRVENTDGIACQVAGMQSIAVKDELVKHGEVVLTIRHLGKTGNFKYRQPTFAKMVDLNERM